MDKRKAHTITLWCAVLSKSDRAIDLLLPTGLSNIHIRMMLQLALSDEHHMGSFEMAHALVAKPQDIDAASILLKEFGYIVGDCDAANPPAHFPFGNYGKCINEEFLLTDKGDAFISKLGDHLTDVMKRWRYKLSCSDDEALRSTLIRILTRPGSYYCASKQIEASTIDESPIYRLTVYAMMQKAATAAIKSSGGLSFTDYRFILELYPKKHAPDKMLRAKDVVSRLRTGRSYITTASVRLEKSGLIERIPDPDDARGILFKLTSKGYMLVEEIGDDLFAMLSTLIGDFATDRRFLKALRSLLQGIDEIYDG